MSDLPRKELRPRTTCPDGCEWELPEGMTVDVDYMGIKIWDWLTEWAKESPELYAKAAGEAKQREIARLETRLSELRS